MVMKRGRGRPTSYTPKLAQEITERLSVGEPLAKICRDEHMPAVCTVGNWKKAHKEFLIAFTRARDEGFDAIAMEALDIADDGKGDWIKDKNGHKIVNHDVIQRSKLRVETRLKLLAKWDPSRYGDRMDVNNRHSGDVGFGLVIHKVPRLDE